MKEQYGVVRMSKSKSYVTILASLMLALFLLPGAAMAHPVGEDSIITPKGEIRAGITPDSALHLFDKMFDGIGLALTFDDSAKAEKGLHIARERLVEAKEMFNKGNTNAARIAQQEHSNALSVVEDSIRKLHNSNVEFELERKIEIEIELEEHQSEIETIKALIKSELSSKSDSSTMAEADNTLTVIRHRTDDAKSEVELEKENSAQRLKQQTGKSDNEIELEVRRREDSARRSSRGGMVEVELDSSGSSGRLEESSRIRAFVSGDSSQARVEVEFTTTETDRNAILKELLSKLKMSSSDVTSALDIENVREERKDEVRTDIRVRDGIAEVKFRIDFPVSSTSREAIAKAIADELSSLTESELRTSSRFEIRENDELDELEDERRGRGRGRGEDELRGRDNELGEDIRGNADENEVRGREAENELRGRENEPGEDIRGNADENELRGRENEPGEDVRGNADENEVRGREAEGEAPRGADSPSDFDSTPGSRGGGSSGGSGSGRGGGSSDD